MALTDKQEMFCREYFIDLNATQAAIRATAKRLLTALRPKACQNPTSSQELLNLKRSAMIWMV